MRKIHLRIACKVTFIISFWIFLHWTAENVHTSVCLHIFKYLCILNLCFYSIFKVPIASFMVCIHFWRCNMNRINILRLCDYFKDMAVNPYFQIRHAYEWKDYRNTVLILILVYVYISCNWHLPIFQKCNIFSCTI